MVVHSSVMDVGLNLYPACDVTLGLLLHGCTLLCILANSHLITQARTSFSAHQWLIERVWRVEPALSGYFSTSLFRHPMITSKHDYFYLLDSAAVWTRKSRRRWVYQCRRRQQQALGDMGAWELGAGRLASLRWDWVVHTSPVTHLWVLLTCTAMLVELLYMDKKMLFCQSNLSVVGRLISIAD